MAPHRERIDERPVADEAVWLQVSAMVYIPLTAACMGWVGWRHGPWEVAGRFIGEDPIWWLCAGLGSGVALAAASQQLTPRFDRARRMSDALAAQLGPMGPATTLALAVLSSVGEEWCFRGVLQPAWGWLPATVLFALVHVPVERDLWPWPVLAGGIGLVLAAMFAFSGGLVGPIALHFAINAMNLRWLARRARDIRTSRATDAS